MTRRTSQCRQDTYFACFSTPNGIGYHSAQIVAPPVPVERENCAIGKRQKREPRPAFAGRGSLTLAMSYSRTTYRCTTIGAAVFNFRVRNGNGWFHCAMITRRLTKPKVARGGRSLLNFTRISGAFESVICGICPAAAINQPPACNH